MPMFSVRYEAALTLAARSHSGQFRKGTDVPYIVHPVHVASILAHYAFSEDEVIAGLLHDVVEDSSISLNLIAEEFGQIVMNTVDVVTERKKDEHGAEIPWEQRRAEALDRLRQGSLSAAAVKAADTIHNAMTLSFEINQHGESVWRRFTRGPCLILDNYRAILAIVRDKLIDHPIVDELAGAISGLEMTVAEGLSAANRLRDGS